MEESEAEKLLAILKKTLSGTLGKNLVDLSFATSQVVDSEEHRLLSSLRTSGLADDEAVHTIFTRIAESVQLEGSYLILLASGRSDVPYRAKDGETLEDASSEVYTFSCCAACAQSRSQSRR